MNTTEKVIIDKERCKECGLCISVCPQNILENSEEINSHGYHPVEVKNQEDCIGCGLCALMCPDIAITIYKDD